MGQKNGRTENKRISRAACGIDVHKEKCSVYVVDADQGPTPEDMQEYIDSINRKYRRVPSKTAELRELAFDLKRFDEVEVLIENSTKSHDVYWTLTDAGLDVIVAHAADLYRITKSNSKNDDKDAMELANYMRRRMNGEVEFAVSYIPDKMWMERRELSRFLADQSDLLSRTKRQVRMHLLLHGISTSKDYQDISSPGAIKELRRMGDAHLELLALSMERTKELMKQTTRIIEENYRGDRMFEILYSIPGFGVHTAAYIASMIADIGRFENGKSLSSYFGLRPRQRDSADSNHELSVTKRGDALARRLIYQATFVHVTVSSPDSVVTRKYERLKAEKKPFKVRMVACANSMAMMLYSMIANDTTFTEDSEAIALGRRIAESIGIDSIEELDDDFDYESFLEEDEGQEADRTAEPCGPIGLDSVETCDRRMRQVR